MKKGDLYYLMHIPETKVLVTKVYKKRHFHQTQGHFNYFPAISIVPCVEVVVVAGKHKGEKEKHTQEKFNRCFRKIKVEDERR